ncbi:TonB-dependent receptor [Carboxylicivirga sp. M1479]|uniref:SusC/RagA family TonB-linked outer membrane protein n=1 Tax=Carboxylicivirga sp. M1479 TaxID=2594476 RepID=UPI0011783E60|nr:TonB-dependent receptor [Carboxylicivirga sp. M1479]TRX71173.1 TonB-dependent receptor [Carboxylicivirga sp. M1479]
MKSRNWKNLDCIGIIPIKVLLLILLFFGAVTTNAASIESTSGNVGQQVERIKGVIVDKTNAPLPGVSIVIKGTSTGTITDINGNYSLDVPAQGTIVISYIGFETQEIVVLDDVSVYDIVMLEDTEDLDEVVVIGYGTQKKETVTGAMSTVSSKDIVAQPVSTVTQALAGRLPGLITNQAGGRPGKDAPTIKIRGIGTLDAGAGSNPLILIDGIERDQLALNYLDPNEIESLSILKDASSTAVFGVRGANGVILVTTKRGKLGPAKINFKANVALVQPTVNYDLINSYEQTALANEYLGFAANSTDPSAPYPQALRERYKGVVDGSPVQAGDEYFYPSTNYEDLMFKDNATQQQYNFTINGGTDRVKYFASLGYFQQGGLFENLNPNVDETTSYERYNYRTNMDVSISKTTLAKINIGGSYNRNVGLGQGGSEPSQSYYWNMLNHSSPWDGYMHEGKVVMLQDNANSVLLNSDVRGYNIEMQNTADYSLILEQKLNFITEGLSFKGTASLISYFRNYINRSKDPKKIPVWKPYLQDDGSVEFYQSNEDVLPYNSTSQGKSRKEYYEAALNYKRTFNNDHSFTGLALFNAEKSHFSQSYWNEIPRAYLGMVGRVAYNYKNKYMVDYNLGYNGSENFAEGERFGFFPAYSAGWTFTEESFLKNLIGEKILSYGKFRFSYGTVGNDKMSQRFLYLPDKYNMDVYNYRGWRDLGINFGIPGEVQKYPVAYQGAAGNPNVTWEKAIKTNYGINLSFLEGLISLKADYFTEDRQDILINQRVVPVYQQTGALALNLGRVKNKGYEVELGWNKPINNGRYWVNMNYSFARNEIIEMDEPEQEFDYRAKTGRRVGEIWGYQQEDYFRTAEEANAYKQELWERYSELNPGANEGAYQAYEIFSAGNDVSAGDLKFIDRNNDGVINDLDAGYIDMVNFPESTFALNAGIQIKNISFSVLLQGATNYSINSRTNYSPNPTKGSIMDYVLERYTPEKYEAGETINYPRLVQTNDNWSFNGTYWYQDATYLRVKSLEIGYTFDKNNQFVKSIGLDNLRIYANGLNLLTFTDIKYIDPETTNGQLRYPSSRIFNVGVSVQF